MDDGGVLIFWLVVLAIFGGVAWFVVKLAQGAAEGVQDAQRLRTQRQADIRATVERRLLQLVVEFPEMYDADIAMILRDELQNAHEPRAEFYQWATPETVGRIRRTLLLQIARDERARAQQP